LIPQQNSNQTNQYTLYYFTTADGLPDDFITNIVNMPDHKIGIGTNNGLAICEPNFSSQHNGRLNNIEVFNINTGYPIKDINAGHHAMFIDHDGVLWAGTGYDRTGLIKLDYKRVQKSNQAPIATIEKLKLKEQNNCCARTIN
jgi:hypothetical protein